MRPPLLTPEQFLFHFGEIPAEITFPFGVAQAQIFTEYFWELENICLFQQAAHGSVVRQNQLLDRTSAEFAEIDRLASLGEHTEDEHEQALIAQSRRREAIYGAEATLDAIEAFNSELTTVAIWTVVEKTLVQTLLALEAGSSPALRTIRFDALKRRFLACKVDLAALPGHQDVDECRCVNNAIKHGGVISTHLSAFPNFTGKAGKRIRKEVLETQRYLFGAYTFLGYVLRSVEGGKPA